MSEDHPKDICEYCHKEITVDEQYYEGEFQITEYSCRCGQWYVKKQRDDDHE